MTSHSQIKLNLAQAIADDEAVVAYCVEKFGRAPLVIVDWFGAQGAPGVKEAPFVFVYSAAENEAGFVSEETFSVHVVVGGSAGDRSPSKSFVRRRTNTSAGIVVNGVAAELEHLRGLVEAVVLSGGVGAVARTVTREESSTADWPLEWAELNIDFFEPETI